MRATQKDVNSCFASINTKPLSQHTEIATYHTHSHTLTYTPHSHIPHTPSHPSPYTEIEIIIIFMNNLASLKSELLLECTEETITNWKARNFYEHHTLHPRSHIKSSEMRNQTTSRKLNFIIPSQTSTPSVSSKIEQTPSRIIGRNLFSNPQKQKLPGPGTYDWSLKRYSSCYIQKEENHLLTKIARKMRRRQMVNECRGPGLYNPQKAYNHSSRSLSVKQTKILPGDFTRAVLPQMKQGTLYLATTFNNFKLAVKQPTPTSYDIQRTGFKTSNFHNLPTHKISTTQRSNIAKIDSIPGPGFYDWSKAYQRNIETKTKPSIQFKFVHGHPS